MNESVKEKNYTSPRYAFNDEDRGEVSQDNLFPMHETQVPYSPTLGKSFVGFKEALGFKESGGDYFTVNTLGYLGKYQFGKETLKLIGIHNPVHFLSNPELQEKAFIANAERNKWVLRKDIKRFSGKVINGTKITESGILAAAHLAGPGNVKKYLRSFGADGFSDAYGTSVAYYIKKFSGYDTSKIEPNKKAKVKHSA
ncbi:peptidoglycan-binding protein LysM [Xanthomarina sp.]|uniref:peptidoglycan-binding protein LysM n=1 Tax=Xanthomarina sp. TaxID=1931211 RepID=UPI002D1FB559|nr:peptidoglycan-binding protein LysM [Xanthomarina sp.]